MAYEMFDSLDMEIETDAMPSLRPSPNSYSIPSNTECVNRVTWECHGVQKLSLIDIPEETNDSEEHRAQNCENGAVQLNDDNAVTKTKEPRNFRIQCNVPCPPQIGCDGANACNTTATAPSWENDELVAINERDSDGDTCLHNAIILQKYRLAIDLIILMAQTMSLDLMNKLCQTPLHIAVLSLQRDLVSMLVKYGADISLRDNHLRTPLHIATSLGDIDSIQRLLSRNGDNAETLNLYNEHGQTCLQKACSAKRNNFQLLKILLSRGADVNLGDRKSERTPLHFAAESGNFYLVRFLIRQPGIVIDKKTRDAETPLILAQCRRHEDIVTCLCGAGAKNLKALKRCMD